jgi:hypothetical protein
VAPRTIGGLIIASLSFLLLAPDAASAQFRPRPVIRPRRPPQPLIRIAADIGVQGTELVFEDNQTFQQYLETGSFKFEQTIHKPLFFDGGAAVRIWKQRLYAGMMLSYLSDAGSGHVTGQIPHPLLFGQPRSLTGDVSASTRREIAEHFQLSWTMPTVAGLEFTGFGGPSIFMTKQTYVSDLNVGLEHEVYPFDTFAFAGATTDTVNENIFGYNIGVDMTWQLSRSIGASMLLRYSNGRKDFTPPGGVPFTVEAGGLHAGGGLRVILWR